MRIRGIFRPFDCEAGAVSKKWFESTGMVTDKSWQKSHLFIDLKEVPSTLAYFSHVERELDIVCISPLGVTLYLVHLDDATCGDSSDIQDGDGYFFIPIENVVSISTFGTNHTIRPRQTTNVVA